MRVTGGLPLTAAVTRRGGRPGTNPGERLWFHSNNGAVFLRSRLIVTGDTLYNVLYVGHSDEQRNNPAVGNMLDTFTPVSAPPVAETTTAPATTTTSH